MSGPFPLPNLRPDVVTGTGAPDFWTTLLNALPQGAQIGAGGYAQSQENSRSSAANALEQKRIDLAGQQLKLQQEQERTKQAQLAHQQELTAQQGALYQQYFEHALPYAAATGQMNQIMQGAQGPQGAPLPFQMGSGIQGVQQPAQQPAGRTIAPAGVGTAPPSTPPVDEHGIVDPFAAVAQTIQGQDPEVLVAALPHLLSAAQMLQTSRTGKTPQSVNVGDRVLQFYPGKGYYDPKSKDANAQGFVSEEQIRISEYQRMQQQWQREQAAALADYRQGIRGQVARTQFVGQTRDIRTRGILLQQAIATVNAAEYSKDPAERRLLMGSALANFVQASDQRVQLRSQMLEYFMKHVDSSIKGNLQIGAAKLATGQYPDAVYTAMANHLRNQMKLVRGDFERQRAGFVKTQPQFDTWLPDAEEFFSPDAPVDANTPILPPAQFLAPPPPQPTPQ